MADKEDINEEYQFTELDPLNPEVLDEQSAVSSDKTKEERSNTTASVVKRNAIIAVSVFFLLIVIYKFSGSVFDDKKIEIAKAPATFVAPPPSPAETTPATTTQESILPVVSANQRSTEVQEKMSSIETNQQSIRADMSAFSNQVTGMSQTIDDLSKKISDLASTINVLNEKLVAQEQEINKLSIKRVVRANSSNRVRTPVHYLNYYIQAVIPGRAWLVATNGSTLTIREGSTIPGYGIVKLIDASQGHILTSSGKMIRFSQDDS